jgi:hypothetical protein
VNQLGRSFANDVDAQQLACFAVEQEFQQAVLVADNIATSDLPIARNPTS